MKVLGITMVVVMLSGMTSYGQGRNAEVPGDNFSLEGALELFKQSESPEHFEKLLNSPDSKVNNLDLNGDGYIDYIRVFNRNEGNVHAFILQAVISEYENQDVAVIELEKQRNGKAVLQIIGDEDIYGVTTIIEPTREVRTYAGTNTAPAVVNVWAWPSVQYVYSPYYAGWHSPWGWSARPVWYQAWRPVAYVHYYPVHVAYRPYYTICNTRRVVYAHDIYRPYRTTSVIVHNRHHTQINHYRTSNSNGNNGRTRNDDHRYTQNGRAAYSNADHQRGGGSDRNDRNGRSANQREGVDATNRQENRGRNVPAGQPRTANGRPTSHQGYSSSENSDRSETRPEIRQRATQQRTDQSQYNNNTRELKRRENANENTTAPNPQEHRSQPTRSAEPNTYKPQGRNLEQNGSPRERAIPAQRNNPSDIERNNSNIRQQRQASPQQINRPTPTERKAPAGGARSGENRRGKS